MKRVILFSLAIAFLIVQSSLAQGYKPGDVATDFKLKNVDGQLVSLADFKDAKGYIVIFTSNSCPFSVAYEDRIIALDARYKSSGFPVVAINANDPEVQPKDSYEAMQVRAKEKSFTYPYLFDDGQKIFPQYGATKTPHIFILQKEKGKLVVKYIGAIDNNYKDASEATEKYVEEALDALLAKKPVKKTSTVAVGCIIKVKK